MLIKLKWKMISCLVIGFIMISTTLMTNADSKSNFEAHKAKILKEPQLIRYYTFEEGQGEEVRNHVQIDPGKLALSGGPLGSLYILRSSPYGVDRQSYINRPSTALSPEWTTGRWPWKSALTSGLQRRCVFRSGVTGKNFKEFTFEAWVRTHKGEKHGSLFSIAQGYKVGLSVTYKTGKKGSIYFKVGVPKGAVAVFAAPFKAGVWHHLVCTSNGKELKVYVDGELRAKKALTGPYTPPLNNRFGYKPFQESRGSYLQIGGRPATRSGDARFDIGELAIYESELLPEKVKDHYLSGKPEITEEQQLKEFAEIRNKLEKTDKIQITIPKDSWGYFPMGTKVPLQVVFPAESGFQGDFLLTCRLTDLKGTEVWKKEQKIVVQDRKSLDTRIMVPTEKAGIFFLDAVIQDSTDKIVKKLSEKYCLGFTVQPTPKNEISPLNPLGIQACLNPWMARVMPLDRLFTHSATPRGIERYKKDAARVMAQGPQFSPMFWCISFSHHRYKKIGPEEEKEIRDYVTKIVKELKDTAYCWEIMNEPNGKFSPETYMKILTICSEIIRKESPDKLIVAPGASPSGIPFINRILEMGASKLIDVVSFHNYTGTPIYDLRWRNTAEKLKKVIAEHAHKKLPIWNSESGIFILPRVGEKSMTYDQGIRTGFRKNASPVKKFFNTSMPTFTEEAAAAIQVQAILMDLAAGYQKYIKCQGPSLPGLEGTNTITLPTLQGIALTALSKVVNTMVKIELLPLSSINDACVIVTNQKGKRTAVAFSDDTPTLTFKVMANKTYQGMDMLGNPLNWKVSDNGLILVELGENPVYIFDVPKNFKQVSPLTVACPKKLVDDQPLKGSLIVSNPFNSDMNATLSASPIKGAKITIDTPSIQLASGKKKTVTFVLNAEKLKRRQYEIHFSLKKGEKLIASASAMFDSPGSIVKVPEVTNPIKLDGDDSEWKNIPVEIAKDEENVVHGKPNLAELWLPQWRNNEDLSFSVQTAWRHNDAVYVMIKVKDNQLKPAPKGHEGLAFQWDCLELFFDSRIYGKRSGPVSIGADQVIVIPRINKNNEKCIMWYVQKDKAMIKTEFVGRKTDDGYLLEGKIVPIKGSKFKLRAGSQFCMDLLFDDTDKPSELRKAAMTLHGIFNNCTDSGKWGRYQLESTNEN